ncbi:MAG: hypothetical protein QXU97_01055 [Fervidicoccaceae archaeon]
MILLSARNPPLRVKTNDREVELEAKVLATLRRYFETQMTLEELAKDLGLESWEEAYELAKRVPAWLVWSYGLLSGEAETERSDSSE